MEYALIQNLDIIPMSEEMVSPRMTPKNVMIGAPKLMKRSLLALWFVNSYLKDALAYLIKKLIYQEWKGVTTPIHHTETYLLVTLGQGGSLDSPSRVKRIIIAIEMT